MVEEQPPSAEPSSEDANAMTEAQPPQAAASSPETSEAVAGDDSAASDGADGADADRRPLCRSSTDKVVAGVAGGIGAYFGIDSVIVRIAFIVLTFLGGAGPFLYLIGWLALPREDYPSVVANALRGDSPHRLRSLAAVVLIGLGLLITANLSGELFGVFVSVWSIAPYVALILIAAGVALVLWPGSAGRPKPTPARPPAPPAPAPGAPPPSSAYATGAPPPPTAAGPEWSAVSPAGPPPPSRPPVSPERQRRGRSPISLLTVAALFVYTGASVMLDRLDVVETDIGVFLAIALAITGAGLFASAFARPARGLILLGVMLSLPLLLFVGSDVRWGTGIGEARVRVTDVEELEDEYRHGIGQMIVDLRDLDPERTDHAVDLSLGIGELRVYVPDNLSTTADIDVGAGQIRVWHSNTWESGDDGVSISRKISLPVRGEPDGALRLDIDVGIGEVEVITAPATDP